MCSEMEGGRTICALSDGAVMPIKSSIEKWRDEYEAHVGTGCPRNGEICEVEW